MDFIEKSILKPFQDASEGKYVHIDLGNPVNQLFTLEKATITMIAGDTGSGKTATWDAFLKNAYREIISGRQTQAILTTFYFVLERPVEKKLLKWFAGFYGSVINPKTKHGYQQLLKEVFNNPERFPEVEEAAKTVIPEYRKFINNYGNLPIQGKINFYNFEEGNPTGIRNVVKNYMNANGQLIYKFFPGGKRPIGYTPNNPKEIVLIVVDTVEGIRSEARFNDNEFLKLNKLAEYLGQELRDVYGASTVLINQLNQKIEDPNRQRLQGDNFRPTLRDIKLAHNLTSASDKTLLIFFPERYKVVECCGYYVDDFTPPNGAGNMLRSLLLPKNSDGADNVEIPYIFFGHTGEIQFLPYIAHLGNRERKIESKRIAIKYMNYQHNRPYGST